MLVGSLILAGGRSRRMGKPKEALAFGDNSLLGRTVETLLDCTWPVIVVGRGGDQELPPYALEALTTVDEQPGKGPLAAIVTGMRFAERQGLGDRDAVLVTGCDAPFLTARAVGWLAQQLGDADLAIPRAGGVLQPLCAIYRLAVLPAAEALLHEGTDTPRTLAEKVRAHVLDEPELRRFDPELRFLRSINTPEEYERALADAGG